MGMMTSYSPMVAQNRVWNTGIPGHNLVPTDGNKQKLCRYCRANETKSSSGWKILTRSKCDACDVPLCRDDRTERNCFRQFHERYVFNVHLPKSIENQFN